MRSPKRALAAPTKASHMNFDQWRARVLELHPTAQFTLEDGSSKTYGELGGWTAHTGPDMQADVVGIFNTPGSESAKTLKNGVVVENNAIYWIASGETVDDWEEGEAEA